MCARPRSGRGWLAAGAAFFTVALSSPSVALAQSAHRPWQLEWNAPAQCPDAQAVRSEVARLLDDPSSATQSSPSPIIVRATVSRRAGRWTVVLRTVASRGTPRGSQRSLADLDCAPLAEATALIVALAANPALGARLLEATHTQSTAANASSARDGAASAASANAASATGSTGANANASAGTSANTDAGANVNVNVNADADVTRDGESTIEITAQAANTAGGASSANATSEPDRTRAPSVALAPIAVVNTVAGPTPASMSERAQRAERTTLAPARPVPVQWSAGAAFAVDSGLLPSWALGASVWGALHRGSFRAELAFGFWPERAAMVPEFPTAGGTVTAYSSRVAGCYVPRWGMFDLGGCASVDAAIVHGRGRGVSNPSEAWTPWVAAGLALHAAAAPVRTFAFVADLGGAVSISRPAFYLEAIGTFFQTPALSLQGRIGVEVRF